MSPAYRASFADAQAAPADITAREQARRISADRRACRLPAIAGHADVTDACLVELARAHGLKLATLDGALCARPRAAGIAEVPFGR